MGISERKSIEKQLRRSQILDAARSLLFSSGIDSISISAISNRSELSVGTIYFYFRNKEEIFAALQEEGLSLLYADIKNISETPASHEARLTKIAAAYYRFSEEHKHYFDMINHFLSSPVVFFEPDLKTRVDMSGLKILAVIRDIVESGIREGVFFEENPSQFSVLFFGALHGLLHFKKLEKTLLENQRHRDLFDYSVQKLIVSIKPLKKG